VPQPGLARDRTRRATALETAAKRLTDAGAIIEDLVLPDPFNHLPEAQNTITNSEAACRFCPNTSTPTRCSRRT